MHINLVLNDEQTNSIKQSLFSVLSTGELAGTLFSRVITDKFNTNESKELKTALINFLRSIE